MKKLVRFLLFAVVVAGVVWFTRERMLPKPTAPDHHPPPFRQPPRPASEQSATASAAPDGDDLQRVKGIGPVYESKLHDIGIRSFAALLGADSEAVAEKLEVQVDAVVDWKTQASEFLA
jgi:predicted flap endonuclease-1-like 5' DNA nuclease